MSESTERRTIWKYPLVATTAIDLEMPKGARVLTVQTQNHAPVMWALVDPAAAKELRRFRVVGTGHEGAPDRGTYIGTFQLQGGSLVFHVFEVPRG